MLIGFLSLVLFIIFCHARSVRSIKPDIRRLFSAPLDISHRIVGLTAHDTAVAGVRLAMDQVRLHLTIERTFSIRR